MLMPEAASLETQEECELATVAETNRAPQASSSSWVEDDTFIMPPNSFDIILLIDTQETTGYVLLFHYRLLNETDGAKSF